MEEEYVRVDRFSYQVYVWWAEGTSRSAAGANNVKLSCWATSGYVVVADAVRIIRR